MGKCRLFFLEMWIFNIILGICLDNCSIDRISKSNFFRFTGTPKNPNVKYLLLYILGIKCLIGYDC